MMPNSAVLENDIGLTTIKCYHDRYCYCNNIKLMNMLHLPSSLLLLLGSNVTVMVMSR